MKARLLLPALVGLATLALSACAVTDVHKTTQLPRDATWTLLPMVNYAEAPQAGQRAEAIVDTLLRQRGINDLVDYPSQDGGDGLPDLDDRHRLDSAMQWARGTQRRYGVRGAVSEWGYKTGLDGEPAVGLSVEVVDLSTGQVVWAASGADSGWGYDSVSGVAQSLLSKLIARMPLQ
ncbi:DUF4136 domain-containing protein [Solimonas marina]|uniref:DUF4136 domain-containing protein n=1 Tax=Solimonas marina TaxID=2714601 RepID=A0A970B4V2_9GAMM|nr:DUF4136 domain-containing protein [Solimonas marina]NKF20915.1 DUF4136 domain-containing protein [Solimonas marina]